MISREEVEKAIFHGEVIEDYPEDPRRHSCLICYHEPPNRPIHLVCSPKVEYLAIITTIFQIQPNGLLISNGGYSHGVYVL